VGGDPGVRSHRHRAKMPFELPIHTELFLQAPPDAVSVRILAHHPGSADARPAAQDRDVST